MFQRSEREDDSDRRSRSYAQSIRYKRNMESDTVLAAMRMKREAQQHESDSELFVESTPDWTTDEMYYDNSQCKCVGEKGEKGDRGYAGYNGLQGSKGERGRRGDNELLTK